MSPAGPIDWLRERAPWLFAPGHGTCLVGSQALAVACERAGVAGPQPADLDLAWLHDTQRGTELLVQHGVHLATTEGNVERGTLAMKLDGRRIEVTTLRAGRPEQGLHERIHADLAARDMTIGALAVELATGRVHDPLLLPLVHNSIVRGPLAPWPTPAWLPWHRGAMPLARGMVDAYAALAAGRSVAWSMARMLPDVLAG